MYRSVREKKKEKATGLTIFEKVDDKTGPYMYHICSQYGHLLYCLSLLLLLRLLLLLLLLSPPPSNYEIFFSFFFLCYCPPSTRPLSLSLTTFNHSHDDAPRRAATGVLIWIIHVHLAFGSA